MSKKGFFYRLVRLLQHTWPGNVRQLKNVVENLVTLSVSNIVRAEDIPTERGDPDQEAIYNQSFQLAKKNVIAKFEREYLLRVMKENDWNISRAARQAQCDRRSFQRLIKKHALPDAGSCARV